jgi:hypothetical protein
LIVVHAGTQSEGLIDGCDLVFLVNSKDGDFVFHEWFENQLMPVLKNPSLVALDNVIYHKNRSRQSNPHFAYLHAKQSNVWVYPRVFLGHQTHHSEVTYNLCSDFG